MTKPNEKAKPGDRMPRVSVIMPAYNVAETVGASIASIQAQSCQDWELIVVDDGSADDTAAHVMAVAEQDERIRLIRQENGGVSAARNAGLAAARGTYISFLDADDLWRDDALAALLQCAEKTQADFVYGRTEELFSDGRKAIVGSERAIEGYVEDFLYAGTELRLTFHISAVLIKTVLIREYEIVFPFGVSNSEDTAFFLQLLSVARPVCVPRVLSIYMRREGSATDEALWRPSDWEWQAGIFDRILPFVRTHRPQAADILSYSQAYLAYRFVLRALRHGFSIEAAEYIERNRDVLERFLQGNGRWRDRLKCRLLLCAPSALRNIIVKL